MNLTLCDLGIWGVAFTGAWLFLPPAWKGIRRTAFEVADGFGGERLPVSERTILVGIGLVGALSGALVWCMTRGMLLAALAAGLGVLAPGGALAVYQAWRRRRFQLQFMDALLMICNSLRAGFNLSQAVEIAAREMPAPARDEFGRVVRDRDLGVPLDEGLDRLAVRMEGESVRIFVTAVQVGRQTGGDLTLILDGLIKMIRERERVEERIRTMTAETRFQGYTLAALPYLLLAGWFFCDPQGVRSVFTTGWGRALLVAGTVFNGLALLMIRKMATIKI